MPDAVMERLKALVGAVVAFAVSWVAAKYGLHVDDNTSNSIAAAVTGIVVGVVVHQTPNKPAGP